MSPQQLAEKLHITLPPADAEAPRIRVVGNGAASQDVTPPDTLPLTVIEALCRSTGDRSDDTMAVVGAGVEAGLRLDEIRGAVNARIDLAQRLAERHDDDVLTCFIKAVNERQNLQWMRNIGQAQASGDGLALPSRVHLKDRLLTLSQLRTLPPAAPLIEKLLYRDTLAQLSAGPGQLKSFLALTMCCCLATGQWFGDFAVAQRVPVVYCAAEGASGVHARILGWCEAWGIDPAELEDWLTVLPLPIQLGDSAIDVADAIEIVTERRPGLLALDTRARCTLQLEENSASEQGTAIEAAETIRRAAATTVLAVHHTPRVGNAGRGSNAWDGAVWSDLRVSRDDLAAKIHCEKHKDAPDGCDHWFDFTRHTVSEELMPGVREEERSTLVMSRSVSDQDQRVRIRETLTKSSVEKTYHNVSTTAPPNGLTATEVEKDTELSRATVYRALNQLAERGYLHNVGTEGRPRYRATEKRPPWLLD